MEGGDEKHLSTVFNHILLVFIRQRHFLVLIENASHKVIKNVDKVIKNAYHCSMFNRLEGW